MEAFYISRQGRQEGPHSLELIVDKMESGYFNVHDYIYDAVKNEWILLSHFVKTKFVFEELKKREEVTQSIKTTTSEGSWFLLRGNNQSGPYEFHDLVMMLQNKKAFEYDYVWTPSLSAWERISECSYFSKSKMEPYLVSNKESGVVDFRRKHPRVEHGTSLVFHDNHKLFNANSFELSAEGASIKVNGTSFSTGTALVLHYRPSKKVPAFNVLCEVVNCRKMEVPQEGQECYRLGLKFLKINNMTQKIVREIVAQKAV